MDVESLKPTSYDKMLSVPLRDKTKQSCVTPADDESNNRIQADTDGLNKNQKDIVKLFEDPSSGNAGVKALRSMY